MKIPFLFAAALVCAAPVWAQPDPIIKPPNGLPFRLVSPAEAEKLVTLPAIQIKLKDATVAAALEELQRQSGIELDLENINYSKKTLAKKADFAIETPSFSSAFDAIMDVAGLTANLQRYERNRPWRVDFNSRRGQEGLPSKNGLFALRLVSLNTTLLKNADLSVVTVPQRSQRNNLRASIKLTPDLSLPIIGVARARITRAEDDQGRSLLPEKDDEDTSRYSAYSFYSNNSSNSETSLKLKAPAADAKTLRHFEGVVVYPLVAKSEIWEVPDLLAQTEWNRTFRNGEQTFDVAIKPVHKEGGDAKTDAISSLALNVEVTFNQRPLDGEIPPPLFSAPAVMGALKIVDAKGVELRPNGGNSGRNSDRINTTLNLRPPVTYGENARKTFDLPLKMIFTAPLEVVQTEAPWAFENVPLP